MTSYGVGDQNYSPDDSDDLSRSIAKVMSPTPAAQLVGPPPDIAPKTAPGVSTPQTGTLNYAPIHAVAKNMDTAAGRQQYSTAQMQGVSRPPNDGVVNSISQAPVSPAVSPVAPVKSAAQPIVPAGQPQPVQPFRPGVPLAAQQAQRVSAYNNSAAPAQYAARMSPVGTDPANPDPNASLRPAGSSVAGPQPVSPATTAQVNPPTPLDAAQSKLSNYVNSGSGVSQIQNPFLRGLARVGDVAGSIIAPGVAAQIPGTTLHNQQLIQRQQGVVGNLQGQQQAAAALQDTTQQTAERAALAKKADALAQADAPQPMTAAQAALLKHPELEGEPMTQRALTALGSAAIRGDAQEQTGASHDAAKVTVGQGNNATSLANTETRTNSAQAVADSRNKTQMLLGQLRASVSTSNNERTNQTHLTTSGMRASGGAASGAAGQPGSYKVPADVTKRAALAANVQENAGEVSKLLDGNPDIVGAVQGRFTNAEQMIGNDNPAISALGTRIHNIALAANGAHGVRSQEAVHATEREILNNFHNGPNAIKGALNATTTSVQTFLDDEKNFRQTGGRVAPAAPPAGQPAIPAGNVKVQLPDGRVGHVSASQLNQFVKDHPGAKTF